MCDFFLLLRHPPRLFFFNDTATTEIYTLSLHDALPISGPGKRALWAMIVHADRHIPQPMHSIAWSISWRSGAALDPWSSRAASDLGVSAAPTARSFSTNGAMSTTRSRTSGKW